MSARINGQGPFSMLLDTDADPSVVGNALVRRLKLRPAGISGRGEGIGSAAVRTTPYTLSNVMLAGVQAHRIGALSADLTPLANELGHPLDGVLGRSFLVSRIVQIDFARRQLRFSVGATPASAAVTARITYPSEVRVSGVTVGGRPATATLDTGNNGFVSVSTYGVKALGLTTRAAGGKTFSARGFNGTATTHAITLPTLRIGKFLVGTVPARAFMNSGQDRGEPEINIGNRVLERYNTVTFNFRDNTVTLKK